MTDVQVAYLNILKTADLNDPRHVAILADFRSVFKNQLDLSSDLPAGTVTGATPLIINGQKAVVVTTTHTPIKGWKPPNAGPSDAVSPISSKRRGGRKTRYTYDVVINAVRQTKTLKDAAKLLGMTDPTYIYELARRYNIPTSRNAQLKLPIK